MKLPPEPDETVDYVARLFQIDRERRDRARESVRTALADQGLEADPENPNPEVVEAVRQLFNPTA